MTVLIAGADRLGNIPRELYTEGAKEIIHWTGRRKSVCNKAIPKKIDKVIIFCDFINHNFMLSIKRQAKENGIPVIYCKRAIPRKAD